jgi:hypothetical protein
VKFQVLHGIAAVKPFELISSAVILVSVVSLYISGVCFDLIILVPAP